MIADFTTLIIGFSVFSAGVLLLAYLFFLKDMEKSTFSRLSATILLGALTLLQIRHFHHLRTGAELFESQIYLLLLLATPPSFYFFSKEVLLPGSRISIWSVIHLLPLALSFVVPANIVAPLAFVIGTGYAFWFARFVYGMRAQRSRFRFEMFFFGLFALLALLVLLLGISIPYLDASVFYISYANFIGIAILLVIAALLFFPELLGNMSDAARLTYATSTLQGVDKQTMLLRLDKLMVEERIFENENLNLGLLAETLGISSHQLSELINTEFGYGFSRYIRERRVAEARRLLVDDPNSSILAISLMTGFKSQSNFYAAFREITGEAPGTYRKTHAQTTRDS